MTIRRPFLALSVLLLTSLTVAACGGSAATAESETPAPSVGVPTSVAAEAADRRSPNTLQGIYTEEQAQRGRQVFEDTCSACHEPEDWLDEFFLARWDGESVYRFWYYVFENMPDDAPPYSLPREEVSDVLTYIFQLNGLPAGDTELGSDDDAIDPYWLYWAGAGS